MQKSSAKKAFPFQFGLVIWKKSVSFISALAEQQTCAEKAVCCGRCYSKVADVHTESKQGVSCGGEYLSCLDYILQYSFRQLNDRLGQSHKSRDKLPNSSLQRDNRVGGLVKKDFILSETTEVNCVSRPGCYEVNIHIFIIHHTFLNDDIENNK